MFLFSKFNLSISLWRFLIGCKLWLRTTFSVEAFSLCRYFSMLMRKKALKADKLKKSVEDEIHFLKGRVSELESDLVSKSTEVTSAVSRKEEALSSAFAEIDRLKEENSIKI
ncbi:nuclear-pore anchor-like isoform X2 [Magnolia sinica]|uniref:nuclear-pore anchor-like isoform X2 n=1 Tax=Magnolia sinica TaxID=86752 RepID=UPI00265978BA|nr:nuclear-pore anchor-like isoform X2 [Magnolia sinica]